MNALPFNTRRTPALREKNADDADAEGAAAADTAKSVSWL
jgi:hypothetical protein